MHVTTFIQHKGPGALYSVGMIWYELSIKVPPEYVEPISYLFSRYGRGLSIEEPENNLVRLRTYLPNTSKQRLARIHVGVNLVRMLHPMGELTSSPLEETDWESAWKAHFDLLKVGRKLVIKPTWIDYEAHNDELIIELDPGLAFGTGYHPTTKMCLEALEELVMPRMQVLDLGTGSGILAIAAAKLGADSVLALDIDPTAVKAARNNIKRSGFMGRVSLARGTLPHRRAPQDHFDLVAANISTKVISDRAPLIGQVLKPGGWLVVSGIVSSQHEELKVRLENAGFDTVRTAIEDDWVALLLHSAM